MKIRLRLWVLVFISLSAFLSLSASWQQGALNPSAPENVIKLIFIHHSTGENWLTDGYGDLGRTLGENNYFVSDTNYGWGPNNIGDRTDIPDWLEWFASDQTPIYLQALFNESGQHSNYTRNLPDPGGENEIVMFKSCFPNSALDGDPDDPPGTYAEFTVAGAKYVYNQILNTFAAHPDKLFVVITAPPLSDPTFAENARAFNLWLMNDWLAENQYTLNNVAVFDFYNVLTGPDHHHRFLNGSIEHVFTPGRNTLFYPSDDDHPSIEGSRKATEEFVPLLNIYYHRWKENAISAPQPPAQQPTEEVETPPEQIPVSSPTIDDFEGTNPVGTNGWTPYWDETSPTSMNCSTQPGTAYAGSAALMMDFEVTPGAWATCALMYETSIQDWSAYLGLSFRLHASQEGLPYDVNLYAGSHDSQEIYLITLTTPAESVAGWALISLTWDTFRRASWEANAGEVFGKPNQVVGLAFGISPPGDYPVAGQLWVDDVQLLPKAEPTAAQPSPEVPLPSTPISPTQTAAEDEGGGSVVPCGSFFTLPLAWLLYSVRHTRRKR